MRSAESVVGKEIALILSERGDRPPAINPAAHLRDDLGLTSLNMIDLLTNVCRILDVDVNELSDVDLANVNTVADVVALMARVHSPQT